MAYVPKNLEEEVPGQDGAPTTAMGGGLIGSGGMAGGNPAAPVGQNMEPGTSGTFDNVKKYLDVNKGKSAGLADRVAGVVKGDVAAADTSIGSASGQWKNDVSAGTVNYDPDLVKNATSNPSGMAGDPETASKIAKMHSGTYGGPTDFSTKDYYADAASAVKKANESTQLLGSEEGTKNLLARSAPGRVRGGILSLNNAILGSSPEAQKILAEARKGNVGLDDRLTKAAEMAGISVEEAKKISEATGQSTQAAFGQASQGYGTDLDKTAAGFGSGVKSKAQLALENFQSGRELSPEDMRLIGINGDQYQEYLKALKGYKDSTETATKRDSEEAKKLKAIDPYAFGTINDSDASRGAVATEEDYARQEALNNLAGVNDGRYNFLQDGGAGYNDDLLDYRFEDIMTAIRNANLEAEGIQARSTTPFTSAYSATTPPVPFPNAYDATAAPTPTDEEIKAVEDRLTNSAMTAPSAVASRVLGTDGNALPTPGTSGTKFNYEDLSTYAPAITDAYGEATAPVIKLANDAAKATTKGITSATKTVKKTGGDIANEVKKLFGKGKKKKAPEPTPVEPAPYVPKTMPSAYDGSAWNMTEPQGRQGMVFNQDTKRWEEY